MRMDWSGGSTLPCKDAWQNSLPCSVASLPATMPPHSRSARRRAHAHASCVQT